MMTAADQLAALERMGVPSDKARAAVHARVSRPVSRAEPGRLISEAEEQRRIRRTAIEHGAKVYWLSQARKTQQTPGIPDLWIAFPTFGLWWEVKAVDGRLSPFQEDFRDECQRNGTPWGSGTHDDFCAWLLDMTTGADVRQEVTS